jgi:TolB protein
LFAFGCGGNIHGGDNFFRPLPPPRLTSARIAFASNRGGSVGIHLYDLTTATIVRLSPTDSYDASPAISPDGTRIAFEHYEPDGRLRLMTMAVDGSDRRSCTDDPSVSDTGPHWSPDGLYLLFTRTDPGSGMYDAFAIRADGTALVRITNDGATRALDWSPDGFHLLLVRHTVSGPDEFDDVRVLDANTHGTVSLFGPLLQSYAGGEFSPDGSQIALAVTSRGAQPVSNLTVVALDGTRARSLLTDMDFTSIGQPSWSPDEASIAFSGDSDDLFTVTLAGGPYRTLTTLLEGNPVDQNPDWGPKP